MDAYRVLGVARTLPLEDIEARFRQLIRESHPDVHRAHGAAAVADAERRTRLLTDAMGQIRNDYARAASAVPSTFGGVTVAHTSGAWVEERTAIGGSGPRERAPVPCPHCGEQFVHLADYERHLRHAHPSTAGAVKTQKVSNAARRRRRRRAATGAEHILETISIAVSILVFAAILTIRPHIDPAITSWAVPLMGIGLFGCVLMVIAVVFLRGR